MMELSKDKDIVATKRILTIVKLLGLAPILLGKTNSKKQARLSGLYVLVLMIVLSAVSIYATILSWNSVSNNLFEVTHSILDVLKVFMYHAPTLIYSSTWRSFYKNLEYLNGRFVNGTKDHINKFASIYMAFLVLCVIGDIYLIVRLDFTDQVIISSHRKLKYHHYISTMLIFQVMSMLARKYAALKNSLIVTVTQNSVDHLQTFRFREFFCILFSTAEEFNKIVGWCMAIIFWNTISHLVMYGFEKPLSNDQRFNEISSMMIGIDALNFFLLVINIVMVVISCDGLHGSADDFVRACCLLQIEMPAGTLRDELIYLAKYCKKLSPKCSVMGIFTVNRPLLAALFSTTLTYLVICSQLHSK